MKLQPSLQTPPLGLYGEPDRLARWLVLDSLSSSEAHALPMVMGGILKTRSVEFNEVETISIYQRPAARADSLRARRGSMCCGACHTAVDSVSILMITSDNVLVESEVPLCLWTRLAAHSWLQWCAPKVAFPQVLLLCFTTAADVSRWPPVSDVVPKITTVDFDFFTCLACTFFAPRKSFPHRVIYKIK